MTSLTCFTLLFDFLGHRTETLIDLVIIMNRLLRGRGVPSHSWPFSGKSSSEYGRCTNCELVSMLAKN